MPVIRIHSDDVDRMVLVLEERLKVLEEKGYRITPFMFKTGWSWDVFLFYDDGGKIK